MLNGVYSHVTLRKQRALNTWRSARNGPVWLIVWFLRRSSLCSHCRKWRQIWILSSVNEKFLFVGPRVTPGLRIPVLRVPILASTVCLVVIL
ncbi:hypothetical protein BDW66DRAFT_128420 [Aspergillus desertorum]